MKAQAHVDKIQLKVNEHELNFITDNLEPKNYTAEELDSRGIELKYGIYFDKSGNFWSMTRKEIMMKMMELYSKNLSIEDTLRGQLQFVDMHTDQIKAFNKKLVINKSDTKTIYEKHSDQLRKTIEGLEQRIKELEDQYEELMATQDDDDQNNPNDIMNETLYESQGSRMKDLKSRSTFKHQNTTRDGS